MVNTGILKVDDKLGEDEEFYKEPYISQVRKPYKVLNLKMKNHGSKSAMFSNISNLDGSGVIPEFEDTHCQKYGMGTNSIS